MPESSLLALYSLSGTTADVVIPYIDLELADIQYTPFVDDGISDPIYVNFPLGAQIQSVLYVGFLQCDVNTSSVCVQSQGTVAPCT